MSWSIKAWPFFVPPYAVQIEAMKRGADRNHYGQWLEQGLGKSGVDLANFVYDVQLDKIDAHIIIAPAYLLSGWEDQTKFWGLPFPVVTWPRTVPSFLLSKPFLFVANQESMLYSGGKYLEELMKSNLRFSLSADDAAIKNFNGLTSKRIRDFGKMAVKTRDLCGTPMSQSVMDLYPRLRFLREQNGVNPYQFRNRYAVMGGYMGKQVKGAKNEEELHDILNKVAFRALKIDWWDDMPEKIYLPPRYIEMTKRQQDAYKSMLDDFVAYVSQDDSVFADQVIHMKQKLSQISRGFIIDKENDRVVELVEPKKNPAFKAVKETLENTPGKLLMFTHHTYTTDALSEFLKPLVVTLRGGMSKDEISEAKRQFNENPKIRGMIGIDGMMSRGHTLLGGPGQDRCSTTLFVENSYNLEVRIQGEDRNHRWGQDKAVSYIDLFCSEEDKKIVDALQKKQDLVEAIVNAVKSVQLAQA